MSLRVENIHCVTCYHVDDVIVGGNLQDGLFKSAMNVVQRLCAWGFLVT